MSTEEEHGLDEMFYVNKGIWNLLFNVADAAVTELHDQSESIDIKDKQLEDFLRNGLEGKMTLSEFVKKFREENEEEETESEPESDDESFIGYQ